jgi:hypothetical protein
VQNEADRGSKLLSSHQLEPVNGFIFFASMTNEARIEVSIARVGPTRRCDIDLIRQVGGTRSSGAVSSITDESSLNPEVIAALA